MRLIDEMPGDAPNPSHDARRYASLSDCRAPAAAI